MCHKRLKSLESVKQDRHSAICVILATKVLWSGAQEKTRTSTTLRPLAPEASASTNSATWALLLSMRRTRAPCKSVPRQREEVVPAQPLICQPPTSRRPSYWVAINVVPHQSGRNRLLKDSTRIIGILSEKRRRFI